MRQALDPAISHKTLTDPLAIADGLMTLDELRPVGKCSDCTGNRDRHALRLPNLLLRIRGSAADHPTESESRERNRAHANIIARRRVPSSSPGTGAPAPPMHPVHACGTSETARASDP